MAHPPGGRPRDGPSVRVVTTTAARSTHAPDPRDLVLASIVVAAGIALAVGVVVTKGADTSGLLDLRIYRESAGGLWTGGLYDYAEPAFGLGFTYPPFAGVILWAVRAVPVRALEYAWTVGGALAWLGVLARSWVRSVLPVAPGWVERRPATVLAAVWLGALCTAPVWIALNQGQIGLLLWAALATDVVLAVERSRGAGVLTGLAAAIKVVPAVGVVLLACAGLRRAAATAAAAFGLATLVGAVLLPSESWRYWTDLLWSTRVGEPDDPRNSAALGLITRWLGDTSTATLLSIVCAAAALVLGAVAFRSATRAGAAVSAVVVLGCTTSLISPIAWTHHLVFLSLLLLFPLMAWRAHPTISSATLVVVAVVLIDPLGAGAGDHATWSTLRAVTMAGVLVGHRVLVRVERPDAVAAGGVRASGTSGGGGSSPVRC